MSGSSRIRARSTGKTIVNIRKRGDQGRQFILTVAVGLAFLFLLHALWQLRYPDGAKGEWLSAAALVGFMLVAISFGALAPSRSGVVVAVVGVPLAVTAQWVLCTPFQTSICGAEAGYPFILFPFWLLLMLPMLLGLGLGWALGIQGRPCDGSARPMHGE